MLAVSICIANYRQDQFLQEALDSIYMQTYPNIEVKVYNDIEGIGSGEAFNHAISMATGDIVVLLCADDFFSDVHVIEDIVKCFQTHTRCMHVSRFYYQFVDGDFSPVRAWRGDNVIELGNNPSGLAFRNGFGFKLTNKMFIEAPYMVRQAINLGSWSILEYDTVAVRVHKSTARSKDYYKKRWTGSVVKEWAKLGWKMDDFTHLIQVANYYTKDGVCDEIINFIRVNPFNIFNPVFVFFSITALCTPRPILLWLPEFYRSTWGRMTTRKVVRNAR